jgi:hypothetical protein
MARKSTAVDRPKNKGKAQGTRKTAKGPTKKAVQSLDTVLPSLHDPVPGVEIVDPSTTDRYDEELMTANRAY